MHRAAATAAAHSGLPQTVLALGVTRVLEGMAGTFSSSGAAAISTTVSFPMCVCLCVCVCARNSAVVNSKLRKEQRWRSESYWNGVVQENELQCPSTLRNRAPDNSPIPTHVFWGAQRNGMGRSRGCKVQNPLLSCHATKGHHPERTLVSKFMRVRALCVFARIRSPQWLSPSKASKAALLACVCLFVCVYVCVFVYVYVYVCVCLCVFVRWTDVVLFFLVFRCVL